MATRTPKPPISEIGGPTNYSKRIDVPSALGMNQWSGLVDQSEYVPDLKWPQSRTVYDQMRTDAQVHALYMGATLPIRRYKWFIEPNGAKEEHVKMLAEDLGLPIKGQADEPGPRRRLKNRFSHDNHLYHALLALCYGFMFFEQVGEIVDGQWRLRKLGPRMPHTLQPDGIRIAQDGGLVGIRQIGIEELIPVDRLVGYSWQKEGANWYGRSMLRPMYKNWFIKDKLIRVDLVKHERNGMGVPTAKATTPEVSPADLMKAQQIVSAWRAGQGASTTLPFGVDIDLKGVSGSLPDTLASIRYNDEQMAETMLMMFMKLGQTQTGSRALGETFVDFFALAQETIALWYCDVTNEHVIEDWMDWNFGEDAQAPLIGYEKEGRNSYAVGDIVALIDKGAITVDAELEQFLREQGELPPISADEMERRRQAEEELANAPAPDPNAAPPGPTGEPVAASEADARPDLPTPSSPPSSRPPARRRRNLHPHEIKAATNFDVMDQVWREALDKLMAAWAVVKAEQITELTASIADAKSLSSVAQLEATVRGADVIAAQLETLLRSGVASASAEAVAQGASIDAPDMDALVAELNDRAEATAALLSRSIGEAASRRAVALTGGSLSPDQVAEEVKKYLNELSSSYLEDQFSGALTVAQNTGRTAVMEKNAPSNIYGSELLDSSTCEECAHVDGKNYENVAQAQIDYPTGGYKNCRGGPRCRGTLVAVYGEERS